MYILLKYLVGHGVIALCSLACLHTTFAAENNDESKKKTVSHILGDSVLVIERPDSGWTFTTETQWEEVLGKFQDIDSIATVYIKVISFPGLTFKMAKPYVHRSVSGKVDEFKKDSDTTFLLDDNEAEMFTYTGVVKGQKITSAILWLKPDDRIMVVTCVAPSEEYLRFEADFELMMYSLKLIK